MSGHRAMSDPTLTSVVRYEFRPYAHHEVKQLLSKVAQDFGPPGRKRKWTFVTANIEMIETNVWILDFHFQEASDAILFSLKYQR